MKIAIIGSGISGLTCAYMLNRKHDITIFEKNDYIGGHTHTHEIEHNGIKWNVDSGFIVYNERTYPNFINILDKLGVKRHLTRMGFSVKSEKKRFRICRTFSKRSFCSAFKPRQAVIYKNVTEYVEI